MAERVAQRMPVPARRRVRADRSVAAPPSAATRHRERPATDARQPIGEPRALQYRTFNLT